MKQRETKLNPATSEVLWYGVPPNGSRPRWVRLKAGVRTDTGAAALEGTLVIANGKISIWQGGKLVDIGTYTPSTPITVNVTVTTTTAVLTWGAVSGATHYDIHVDNNYVARTGTLTYTLTNQLPGAHTARVTASNGQTGTVGFTIVAQAPPAPAGLAATAVAVSVARVSWTPNPATDYRNTEVYVNGAFAASSAAGPVDVPAVGTATITARAIASTGLASGYSSVAITMPTGRLPTGATASSTVVERNPGMACDNNLGTAWLSQQFSTVDGVDKWQANVTGTVVRVDIYSSVAHPYTLLVNGVARVQGTLVANSWTQVPVYVPGATSIAVHLAPMAVPGFPGLRSILQEVSYYA